MSLVILFVDRSSKIREEFLGFVQCRPDLSGEAIANTICSTLRELDVPLDFFRGQGYDGACNIAGRLSGAAARIRQIQEKAVYVHCNAYALNLFIATCSKEQLVRNMMDTVRFVSEFFLIFPKRDDLLSKKMKELLPSVRHNHLVDVL